MGGVTTTPPPKWASGVGQNIVNVIYDKDLTKKIARKTLISIDIVMLLMYT